MRDENGKNIAEKGDLSLATLKKVYDTSFSLSMAQQKRRAITAERLTIIRKRHKLTQKELCDQIGVVLTTYSGYEKGKQDIPTEVIAMICKLFDISSDYIIGISEDTNGNVKENMSERIEALEKTLKQLTEKTEQ